MLKTIFFENSYNVQKFIGQLMINPKTREKFFCDVEQTLFEAQLTDVERDFFASNPKLTSAMAIPEPETLGLWGS